MTKITINTEDFSNDALFPRRQIKIGEKEFQTPTKAIPVRKTRNEDGETVSQSRREVCELHRGVDTERLTRARRGDIRTITKGLQTGYNKTQEDDVVFTFLSWKEGQTFAEAEAHILVDILETYSDILTVPLMPSLVNTVEEGLSDTAYQSYRRNVEQFLESARVRAPKIPIMGTIPPLGWEFTDDLMKLYEKHSVRAFCMNFNRRRITAGTQIGMVKPMMRHIARRDIANHVLFYGINMHPGQFDERLGLQPAADMASLGMGFDIVGENHVGLNAPPEAFEDDDDAVYFKFFEKTEFAYRKVLLAELPQHFPENTEFDPDYVVKQSANSDNQRRRLEKLLSAEQMTLATKELQPKISAGSAFEHVVTKPGVTPTTTEALQSVREGFDEGQSQSSLFDF